MWMQGARPFFLIALLGGFGSAAMAEWRIPEDRIARAEVRFTEGGKTVFSLACGHNILLSLRYPGEQGVKKRASVTIRNSGTSISIKGSVGKDENFKEVMFSALQTGGKTPDPADLEALMALFSSGQGEASDGKKQRDYRVRLSATNAKATDDDGPVAEGFLNFSVEEIGR